MSITHWLRKHKFCVWLFFFLLGSVSLAVAQEKPQPEKRYVRWRLIEVARKSLADSILAQLQQGASFQKLARQHSLHASAKEGGEIGWTAIDGVDSDFKTAMASLPIGGTSAILQKGNHFFILHKMKELPESGYLQWREQKAEVDSLLNRIESLTNTGNSPAAMTLIKEAEERVKQIEDEGAYLKMLSFKGRALRELGQVRDSAILFESMLKISRTIGDTYWESIALNNLGGAYFMLGQYPRAIAYCDSALVIARATGHRKNEGTWSGNLGMVYRSLGQYERAIAYSNRALVIARELDDRAGEGSALGNLGSAYLWLDQYPRAVAYYDSALVIARALGNRMEEGTRLGNLGNAYRLLGQYLRAIAYYDSALVIARAIGNRAGEGGWLGGLGNAYNSLSQYPRAIAYYDSALSIARGISDRAQEGSWLGSLGNAYRSLGQYPRAIAYYDSALSIAREIGDRAGEGRHLSNLGIVYSDLGQYQPAIAYYDSALVIARVIGDREGEGHRLGNLGLVYSSLGQYQRAIAHYDSALSIARAIGDRAGEGARLGSLGNANRSLGQYQRAIAFHDSALVMAREIGDRRGEGSELGNLGIVYRLLGQYPRAIAYYDSALGIAREIGDRKAEGALLGNLGVAYRSLGQYQHAITYHNSALGIAREIGDREGEGIRLGSLGSAYYSLGQYPQAIAYYDSALAIARTIGDRKGEGSRLGNLGIVYSDLGQYQRAIAYYDSALGIARKIGNREGEGNNLGNLGNAYKSLGQYQRAIAYHDSALVIARVIGDRQVEGASLGNLGEAYRSLGQYPQAVAYADSALLIAKEIADAEAIWTWYWSLAQSHSKMPDSKTNEVIDFYDNAVAALEKITGQLVQDVHKLSYVQDKQKLYVDYINYLVTQPEPQHHEKALEISEASRTRALRDLLHGQPTQSVLTEDKRRAAMERTEQLITEQTTVQSERLVVNEMTRAGGDKRLENWASQIAIPPDTLASTATAPAIQLQEIQTEVRQHNTTLLEYHVLDDGVAIWVVDQAGKVIAVKQNIAKTKLQALIDSVRQVLEVEGPVSPNKKTAASRRKARTPLLQTLDALLIRPVKDYLPKDSNQPLVILPHDVLFLLPFACLMDSTGQYLAQRYTFSTAPSVGLLKFTREKTREQQDRENPKLLLMGNPKMPNYDLWLPLPGAEKEVKRIADQVNRSKTAGPRQALPLIREQATEVEFRQIASVHNYIHLATHGYVVSDALRCGLVLAETGKTMETDGILTTAEIFSLPLNAELVVLSACQTGLGEISSDGVAGLSRAFLYAGASSLIVSLWTVLDEVTQELMVKFYEELAVDGNKARALQAAQLATMKKHPHPKDWAAFVLVGQPR